MYAFLKNQFGTTAVKRVGSEAYNDLISAGYQDTFQGSKEDCKDEEATYLDALEEGLGALAD